MQNTLNFIEIMCVEYWKLFDETFLSIGVSFLHNIYSSQQIYDRSNPTKISFILVQDQYFQFYKEFSEERFNEFWKTILS